MDADGCENKEISNLREKLSAFLQCETTLKAGFAVQIATVCSLLKTLQLDFSTVFRLKTAMLPGCGDQSLSASANLVTKWFSLLSDEQRVYTKLLLLNDSFVQKVIKSSKILGMSNEGCIEVLFSNFFP